MLTRRSLFSGLVATAALMSTPLIAQEADPFQWAFEQLSLNEKRNLQVELQMAGLYTANVDGAWGPSTRRAIVGTPMYLKRASGGEIEIQLETFGDVETMIRDVASGKWSYLLYREDYEG